MQIAAREIVLWTTPSEPPKALQASECSELLDPMRASCLILAQHQPGKFSECRINPQNTVLKICSSSAFVAPTEFFLGGGGEPGLRVLGPRLVLPHRGGRIEHRGKTVLCSPAIFKHSSGGFGNGLLLLTKSDRTLRLVQCLQRMSCMNSLTHAAILHFGCCHAGYILRLKERPWLSPAAIPRRMHRISSELRS